MDKKFNLIVPLGGKSTRFNSGRPKWLLTHPNGKPMLIESINGILSSGLAKYINRIYFIVLKDIYVQHAGNFFFEKFLYDDKNIIIIDKSRSQPETVYLGLKEIEKREETKYPFLIKDCDNYFTFSEDFVEQFKEIIEYQDNFVCTEKLENINFGNICNKSYVVKNQFTKLISNIVEKSIISNEFSCGGYYFNDPDVFIDHYEKIIQSSNVEDLYVSHIIYSMILKQTENFYSMQVDNFIDWGTQEDWDKFTNEYSTIFIDIDGVLVENSARFLIPRWGETEQIPENVKYINELKKKGKTYIVLTSSRDESYRFKTIDQLEGLMYDQLVLGLPACKRIIVNDKNSSSKNTCYAVNIKRNDNNLRQLIEEI